MGTVKILIAGDFFGGSDRVSELIDNKDFNAVYGNILPLLQDNDLTIVNLESPLLNSGNPIAKTGPAIKAKTSIVEALKYAKINWVTLANNHILDYGETGLQKTIETLETNNIGYIGAGNEAQRGTKYITIDNVKLAIINFCENEWSTNAESKLRANALNPVSNFYQIKEAKKKADKVIVIFHGGNEYHPLPSPNMKETCRFFIDSGADFVVCHHTHCYSGFENYNAGTIFYSLGNFIFDNPKFRKHPWNYGIAVQLEFSEGKTSYKINPFCQCDETSVLRSLNQQELLDFEESLERLNTIIADDQQLAKNYDDFSEKVRQQYLTYIQPYSNRYLNAAYKRGWLPSLLTKNKKLLWVNLIRCESHRNILLKILKEKYENRNS